MEKQQFDVIILGGGPGGYVAAIRAAQKNLKVALVEAKELGGTCLNRGCIPSKALIANADVLRKIHNASQYGISIGEVSFNYSSMRERKDKVVEKMRKGLEGLIASNQITVFEGFGKFCSPNEIKVSGKQEALLGGKSIIIATGSEPRGLPVVPFDYQIIHDSTSFLNLPALPKKLVIIGGGVIGCEFASLHRELGVDVTIIELLPTILPLEGKSVSDTLAAAFRKRGIKIETSAVVNKVRKEDSMVYIHLSDGRTIEADCVLVSVGRKLNSDNIGLEKAGVVVETNGSISTNEKMQTNVPHIYAIGDVTGKWVLAHVASHQGIVAADNISGLPALMHYNAIPSVIFTYPEIGNVGLSLEQAISQGYDAALGKFPFLALGKSQAAIETDGFAQIVVDKKTGQILGAQVIGHEAATLIAEITVAINNELTVESISETIHAHPTIAEAWMEAAFFAIGTPLHLPPRRAKT